MALVTPDGRFASVNRAMCQILGYSRQELLSLDFKAITHPDEPHKAIEIHKALLAGAAATYETEKRFIHRDGHEVWAHLGLATVQAADGSVRYFIAHMEDVTQRRSLQEELAHRAMHDPLTGLPNRALFLDRLDQALARAERSGDRVAVLFVDLDRFKLVNDAMGHKVGDEVLIETGSRLREASRKHDTVARLGGDEFTILCELKRAEHARTIAERVLACFEEPFTHDGAEFYLTASVGIRLSDNQGSAAELVLQDADSALYNAKQQGRARFELFDPAVRLKPSAFATENELRRALRDEQLCIHYQPTIDLRENCITGLEALVRWVHPIRGLVPPNEFIPAAEASGLIVPIGEWVLRTACVQLATWQQSGMLPNDVRVAVNVSRRQLSLPELPKIVEEALAGARLDPACLCLEITESAVINDSKVARSNLDSIKSGRVQIALDDFGVGFSSLSQIRELPPIDVIKIDRSFIAGLGESVYDAAAVKAMITLADSLGLALVAEGIETDTQLEELRKLGCPIGQGFYFLRPTPPDGLESLFTNGSVRWHVARANRQVAA